MKNNSNTNTIEKCLSDNNFVFMEAAVVERLRRSEHIQLHPQLANAPLIYDNASKEAMNEIYNSYIDIAESKNRPIFLCTPTWKAHHDQVQSANINNRINIDAVQFMKKLRNNRANFAANIKIGGLIGCKNDCYLPEDGLSTTEAEEYHEWQINQLIEGGVDFLIAETLPNINEALGIAKALAKTKIPYIIGFVINREGHLLDGTSLTDAISKIDKQTSKLPATYMVNCAYPSFICPEKQPKALFKRLSGIMGNGSSLDHCDLDGSDKLHEDSISDWGNHMINLHQNYGFNMLGGCCGTGIHHLNYIANNIR